MLVFSLSSDSNMALKGSEKSEGLMAFPDSPSPDLAHSRSVDVGPPLPRPIVSLSFQWLLRSPPIHIKGKKPGPMAVIGKKKK